MHRIRLRAVFAVLLAGSQLAIPAVRGAVPGVPEPERVLALDTWEGLTDSFQDDLARFAAVLRDRNFQEAAGWFAKSFHGEVALGGQAVADRPAPFAERTAWKRTVKGKPPQVDAAGSLAPLAELLRGWRAVEHLSFSIPQALFYDRDGKTGAAHVVLHAGGTDSAGRPAALTLRWDLCLRFELDRFKFDCLTMRSGELMVGIRPLFRDATASSGLAGTANAVALETSAPSPAAPGPAGIDWTWRGVSAGDVDGDGQADVFVPGPRGGLFLAREGRYAAGPPAVPGGTGSLLVDLDNDGDQDLVVGLAAEPGLRLFENDGGAFVPRDGGSGLSAGPFVYSLVAADFDGDGFLDLYACRYNAFGVVLPESWTDANNGTPNRLFLQVAPLKFRECAAERGVADRRWSYAAAAADADADGDIDLFVANDYGPDSYFENDGTGRFTDRAPEVGLADGGQGMGADWGDWDGDGQLDLHVANSASPIADRILSRMFGTRPTEGPGARVQALADGNALYLRRRGSYADARKRAGVAAAGWSWGGGFLDFDNDGRLDLFSACGFLSGRGGPEREGHYWRHVVVSSLPVPRLIAELPGAPGYIARQYGPLVSGNASFAGRQRDRVFWNAGKGTGFDVSAISGADHPGDGRGVAFLDDERDGDTDVLVHDLTGVRLLRNDVGASAGWLRLELTGTESNRDAIGARVRVHAGRRVMTRVIGCGTGFASSSDRALVVGLEADAAAHAVDIYWPSGVIEHYGPFAARTSHRLVEGNGELGPAKAGPRGPAPSPAAAPPGKTNAPDTPAGPRRRRTRGALR